MTQNAVRDTDTCGGAIIGTGVKLLVAGLPVALVGDSVVSHGDAPHAAATMVVGSPKLTVQGTLVCYVGSTATCSHTATGGSPKLKIAEAV